MLWLFWKKLIFFFSNQKSREALSASFTRVSGMFFLPLGPPDTPATAISHCKEAGFAMQRRPYCKAKPASLLSLQSPFVVTCWQSAHPILQKTSRFRSLVGKLRRRRRLTYVKVNNIHTYRCHIRHRPDIGNSRYIQTEAERSTTTQAACRSAAQAGHRWSTDVFINLK